MEASGNFLVERTAASAPMQSRDVSSPPAELEEPSKGKAGRGSGKLNQAFRNLNPFKVGSLCWCCIPCGRPAFRC